VVELLPSKHKVLGSVLSSGRWGGSVQGHCPGWRIELFFSMFVICACFYSYLFHTYPVHACVHSCVCVCVCVCVSVSVHVYKYDCGKAQPVEIKVQLLGISSFLPPCGSQGLNSGLQPSLSITFTPEPSHWSNLCGFFLFFF